MRDEPYWGLFESKQYSVLCFRIYTDRQWRTYQAYSSALQCADPVDKESIHIILQSLKRFPKVIRQKYFQLSEEIQRKFPTFHLSTILNAFGCISNDRDVIENLFKKCSKESSVHVLINQIEKLFPIEKPANPITKQEKLFLQVTIAHLIKCTELLAPVCRSVEELAEVLQTATSISIEKLNLYIQFRDKFEIYNLIQFLDLTRDIAYRDCLLLLQSWPEHTLQDACLWLTFVADKAGLIRLTSELSTTAERYRLIFAVIMRFNQDSKDLTELKEGITKKLSPLSNAQLEALVEFKEGVHLRMKDLDFAFHMKSKCTSKASMLLALDINFNSSTAFSRAIKGIQIANNFKTTAEEVTQLWELYKEVLHPKVISTFIGETCSKLNFEQRKFLLSLCENASSPSYIAWVIETSTREAIARAIEEIRPLDKKEALRKLEQLLRP
ncbi:MAG: hypothetical protein K0U13_04980 [Chlamydiae bacterium]|nr:hypothetical protein [Chlamydiota bacterium]